jgi:dCTP deaminase
MILSAQSIRKAAIITPFNERTVYEGMSYGLSSCGYDIRLREDIYLYAGGFSLASSIEHFDMPTNIMAQVADKSSWARKGIAVQNTILEPGWKGYLTIELTNHSAAPVFIKHGSPIAQIIFMKLDKATEKPYSGKYQNQPDKPVEAIYEKT